MIKSKQTDTILEATLENASKLQVSNKKLEDMMGEDRTRSTISTLCGKKVRNAGVRIVCKSQDMKLPRCKHYDEMPYHPLPNASVYGIEKERWNWLSALFGEMEREKVGETGVLNWKNVQDNKNIKYRFNTLGHYRDEGNSKEYWRVANMLLRNRVFHYCALNHVCSGFATNRTEDEVKRILASLDSIIENMQVRIPMKRVYIEKANGKWRPLGVPDISWRVYLHMWNCLIVWWRTGKDKNHAYFPGKGTHTAWEEILPKLLESENIYEFDLTSFFPSVNLNALRKLMVEKLEIPISTAHYLIEMHRSITKLPKEKKLPEENDENMLLDPNNEPNPNLPTELRDTVLSIMKSEIKDKMSRLHEILPPGWTIYREIGVPQGTATSCGLATISLHYIWKEFLTSLTMYADDGILFPKHPDDISKLTDKERGISVNEEKSWWAKMYGKWLKDCIKFLGLKLKITNSSEYTIMGATRKDNNLEFTKGAQFALFVKNEWEKLRQNSMLLKELLILSEKIRYNPTLSKEGKRYNHLISLNLKDLPDITVSEWLVQKREEWLQLSDLEKLKPLFSGLGLKVLSQLYNGSWGIPEYKDVKQHVIGSWLHIHGPRMMYEGIKNNWYLHLEIVYWRKAFRENLHEYLPQLNPEEIWDNSWWEAIPEPLKSKAKKLDEKMSQYAEILERFEDTADFTKALNSLFQWNKKVESSRENKDLIKVFKEMLKWYPLNWGSISTMALAEKLDQGFSDDRSIRRCYATKTASTLVRRIPRDSEVLIKDTKQREKCFFKQFKVRVKTLNHINEINSG